MPRSRLAPTAPPADQAEPSLGGRGTPWGTERRRAPRRLSDLPADVALRSPASDGELATALAAVTDPVYLVDGQWRVRWTNRRAAEVWGGPAEHFVGRSLWEVHPRAVRTHAYERLVHAMRERRAVAFETFSSAFGSWVEACAYPAGNGLLVCYRDVEHLRGDEQAQHALTAERAARSEAERLAAELRAAREAADRARHAAERAQSRAESAARAKSDFLATMSHELRTPINAVTGYAQLLELGVAGPVTDAQREYLARLHASGRHLLGLVDDVLDLARLDAGRLSLACAPASTGSALAAALAVVTAQAATRSIHLGVEPPDADRDAAGLPYYGDEHRVRQILVNLLANAVKFTPPGGTVTVRVDRVSAGHPGPASAAETGSGRLWTCIQVADTGPGVPRELRDAIFEPFVQADGSRTRSVGGTGLGLTISRRLARLMGGDLTLEPDAADAGGATFTLWLPAEPPPGAAMPPGVETTAVIAAAGAGTPPATAASLAIAARPADAGVLPHASRGLGAIAHHLRQRLESILESYVARLRTDASLPQVDQLSRPQLENHGLSFLADLAQALVVIHESGGLDGDLLRDGSAIQEQIAFRHGEQRHRLGWTEEHVRRDYAVLQDELDFVVRQVGATLGGLEVLHARSILHRLLARARDVSVRGWRHANAR